MGFVVGIGFWFFSCFDVDVLGLKLVDVLKLGCQIEVKFCVYFWNLCEIDVGGCMNFGKMQQVVFVFYKCYGEVLVLFFKVSRNGFKVIFKVMMLLLMWFLQINDDIKNIVQGVCCDKDWGVFVGYMIWWKLQILGWEEVEVFVFDVDGLLNVVYVFDVVIGVICGIFFIVLIFKVVRQVDQFVDVMLIVVLMQIIFVVMMKMNISGIVVFDGLMINGDKGVLDINVFVVVKGEWYDGVKIDFIQYGCIVQFFLGDELIFNKVEVLGQQFDQFMGWLMCEIVVGVGVIYEFLMGDYCGVIYFLICMVGVKEWFIVLWCWENIVVLFC